MDVPAAFRRDGEAKELAMDGARDFTDWLTGLTGAGDSTDDDCYWYLSYSIVILMKIRFRCTVPLHAVNYWCLSFLIRFSHYDDPGIVIVRELYRYPELHGIAGRVEEFSRLGKTNDAFFRLLGRLRGLGEFGRSVTDVAMNPPGLSASGGAPPGRSVD
jgi:hypothetical protein